MDNWPDMETDPEALNRIMKACRLLDCKKGMTVLDIGCYRQAARQFLPTDSYFGFDCCNFSQGTIVRDLETGFLWDSKVPRILCLEVLEHLKTPSQVLRSIHDSLSNEGIAVISLPNEATIFHRLRSLFGIVDAECFGERGKHLHLPSLKQCRTFLTENGFEILSEDYYVAVSHSRQKTISGLLKAIPPKFLESFAKWCPALFARGFIFKLKKK